MDWTGNFIAVDWGTTNRRAYRIDESGTCVDSLEDGCGILSVAAGQFPAGAQTIRDRLGDLPLLLGGMVGSNRGWVEAPYVDCPASLDDLVAGMRLIDDARAAIIPGLAVRSPDQADVMRGEEIQVFGAIASGLVPPDCVICHPGTHNKWIKVQQARVTGFRTVMTGEMFSLLSNNGILVDLLKGKATPGPSFSEGVQRSLDGGTLAADLFSARAQVLLGELDRAEAVSYISGLLIGADIGLGRTIASGSEIITMGKPELTRLYAAAATEGGMTVREVDGAASFLAGATALARKLS
jgi:2-dehydro-3-deoxygalactonokinase